MLYGWASPTAVVATCIAMPMLAGVVVVLRAYARLWRGKNAGADDVCILISMLFSIATTATMIAQARSGLGRHMDQLAQHDLMVQRKAFLAMIIMYNLSLTLTKLSILLQYKRVFVQKNFALAAYCTMVFLVVLEIWSFLSTIYTCSAAATSPDPPVHASSCQNGFAMAMPSAALNMFTDLLIFTLPLPLLRKLAISSRQVCALILAFAISGLVIIISILRIPSLATTRGRIDSSYENPMMIIWSDVEINVAIICSCLPTLTCLFPAVLGAATTLQITEEWTMRSSKPASGESTILDRSGDWPATEVPRWRIFYRGFNDSSQSESSSRPKSWTRALKEKVHVTLSSVEDVGMSSTKDMLASNSSAGERRSKCSSMRDTTSRASGGIIVKTEIKQTEVIRSTSLRDSRVRTERADGFVRF